VALALSHHSGAATGRLSAAATQARRVARVEATVRHQAVAWVAQQISSDAVVSCDPVMCAALAANGRPASRLFVLRPATSDPLASTVVVATQKVRAQFGSSLATAYAPTVLASFGSGGLRVDVRPIAPDGAAAYLSALSADLRDRKQSGVQLLASGRIIVSGGARRELGSGLVDSRLLITLADLAARNPVRVIAFGAAGPGASPGTPLRSMDLAEATGAHGRVSGSYVRSMLAVLREQRGSKFAALTDSLHLYESRNVLRVEFLAPSPLNLLGPQTS
jgi:hypothetical protein